MQFAKRCRSLACAGLVGLIGAASPTVAAPEITNVWPFPADYGIGSTASMLVTFSEAVTVTGSPVIGVRIGSTNRQFTYRRTQGGNQLDFAYPAQTGDNGTLTVDSPIILNGGTIRGGDGSDASLSFAPVDASRTTFDTIAPAAPVFSGVRPASPTSAQRFTLYGTAEPGATITLPQRVVKADVTGKWSATIGPEAAGSHTYQAIARDKAGNPSPAASTTVTIQPSTGPLPPVIIDVKAPPDGIYGQSSEWNLHWLPVTVEYSSPVNVTGSPTVGLRIGSRSRQSGPPLNGSNQVVQIVFDVSLGNPDDEGPLTITGPIALNGGTIRAADGTDAPLTFTPVEAPGVIIDMVSPPQPVIQGITPASPTAAQSFTIFGTAEPGGTISTQNESHSPVPVDASGNWSMAFPPRAPGTYTIRFVADDAAGNPWTAPGVPPSLGAAFTFTVQPTSVPPSGWTSTNIATTSGSTSYAEPVATVSGAGADIWGNADAFQFYHRALSGDGEIVARVVQFGDTNTHPWAKAGVMMRESNDPGARNVFMCLSRSNGTVLQGRTSTGGTTGLTWGSEGSTPRWLRLVRAGNTITGSESTDGVTWRQVAAVPIDTLAPGLIVGLAVTSHEAGVLRTASFDNIAVSGSGGLPPAAPSGLQATAMSASEIEVSWTDNSNNETGFHLERATTGGTFARIATAGANVTRWRDSGLTGNTTYHYRLSAFNSAGNSAFSAQASATTPSGPPPPPPGTPAFTTRNIGAVSPAGSASFDSATGIWSVSGSGADIWGNADAFTYASQTWTGDGEFVVRVRSLDPTHGWAKAGLMFREGLDPAARNIFIAATPENGSNHQARFTVGGATDFRANSAETAPIWLKLTREGNVFNAHRSSDGVNWRPLGVATVAMAGTLHVGLAVTSHAPGTLCTARFSDIYMGPIRPSTTPPPNAPSNLTASALSPTEVELRWTDNSENEAGFYIERAVGAGSFVRTGSPVANMTRVTDTGLSPNTTYSYRISAFGSGGESAYSNVATVTTPASPPPPGPGPGLSTQNIGAVSPAGSTTNDGATGTWSVRGGGADIWNSADAFTYASQLISGDGEIIARVQSLDTTHDWAKAGLMFRESMDPGARNIFVAVTPANGIAMQTRASAGGATGFVGRFATTAPIWLKLTRQNTIFRSYYSSDGTNWTELGMFTLALPTSIYAGLAVTSHAPGTLCTARFSNVSVAGTPGATMPPTAPTNLTAGALSASEVELRWTDNASNESGVRVERSTDNTTFATIATLAPNATSYNDRTTAAATTYYYRVRMFNSAGDSGFATASATTPAGGPTWFRTDIGAVGVAGSGEASGNTITLRGSGEDIWGTVDSFHFLYQVKSGDCVVEAQVTGLSNTHSWAKAGVMIREGTSAGARNIFVDVTPTNDSYTQVRSAAGGFTSMAAARYGTPLPYWVRLARTGNAITASTSADGVTWQVLSTHTMAFSGDVLVGFAVTSHNNSVLTTATLADPSIR